VFAEMGSINPVFLLPGKLASSAKEVAALCFGSITLGVGQFCTNPGLIVGIEGKALDLFIEELGTAISKAVPGTCCIPASPKRIRRRERLRWTRRMWRRSPSPSLSPGQPGPAYGGIGYSGSFFPEPALTQEVFGPYSLVIQCKNKEEMLGVVRHLEGQLTTSLMATIRILPIIPNWWRRRRISVAGLY